jgi:hypothetical protein
VIRRLLHRALDGIARGAFCLPLDVRLGERFTRACWAVSYQAHALAKRVGGSPRPAWAHRRVELQLDEADVQAIDRLLSGLGKGRNRRVGASRYDVN